MSVLGRQSPQLFYWNYNDYAGVHGNGFDFSGRGPSDAIAFPNLYQVLGAQASAMSRVFGVHGCRPVMFPVELPLPSELSFPGVAATNISSLFSLYTSPAFPPSQKHAQPILPISRDFPLNS